MSTPPPGAGGRPRASALDDPHGAGGCRPPRPAFGRPVAPPGAAPPAAPAPLLTPASSKNGCCTSLHCTTLTRGGAEGGQGSRSDPHSGLGLDALARPYAGGSGAGCRPARAVTACPGRPAASSSPPSGGAGGWGRGSAGQPDASKRADCLAFRARLAGRDQRVLVVPVVATVVVPPAVPVGVIPRNLTNQVANLRARF